MKRYRWSEAKNRQLIEKRGISFEEIVEAIELGGLLDVLDHPNPRKYSRQKLMVVKQGLYVYVVPFVESEKDYFLKTVIPSRKYRKKYREVL